MGDEWVEGPVVKIDGSISFLGDVVPETGVLTFRGEDHELKGCVLVFREGKGSTVGSYVIYNLKIEGNAPVAMVMMKADAIITMGCIASSIPLVHRISQTDFDRLRDGDQVQVNSARGLIQTAGRL
jgi:predicted aconitase with swiveling domain